MLFTTSLLVLGAAYQANACSRVTYQASKDRVSIGRSMDFVAETNSTFFLSTAGMNRSGSTVEANPYNWTSKYGSVSILMYDVAHGEGVNEKGLTGSSLYLDDSIYPKRNTSIPSMWIGHWLQYFLDTYATVDEVVQASCHGTEPFQVVGTALVPGVKSNIHLAISDPTGDNVVMEFVKGELICYHSKNYTIMTNEPTFDQQLAINTYWGAIAESSLPGTARPADRFARLSYYSTQVPQADDLATATSYNAGMIRAVSVPMTRGLIHSPGASDVWPTYWRVYTDLKDMVVSYESATDPMLFWYNMTKMDFSEDAKPKIMSIVDVPWDQRVGDVTDKFVDATSKQCQLSGSEC